MLGSRARRRLRLQSRMVVSFVLLVAGVIALVIMVVDFRQRHVMMALNRERGLAIGHSLSAASANALLSYNYVALQQLTQRAVREDGVRYVVLLDKEGKVAGYSGRPDWQGKELQDPVSMAAAASRDVLVQTVRSREFGSRAGLDISIPVFVEGSPTQWGLVRVGLSLDGMYAELNRTRAWVLTLGLGVLLLAVVVARLLARRIVRPLERLVEATGELARGNFDYRVGITTGDEIEDLSRKFDGMAREIRLKQSEVESTNRELAALNASLEEKVVIRTRALTEAEEKYRLLVEQSPNPICIVQNRRLVFFNQAFSETFGYPAETLSAPGFDASILADPEEPGGLELFSPGFSGTDASGGPREMRAVRRDGGRIHLDVRSTVISYEGAPALEAILVDVTEQRELQDKVVSYERLRALGEMAGGVAHDFNNVLGAILARAQFLARRSRDEEMVRGLGIIEKAAQDGAETVKRIQEFTRVRTDRDFARVDLVAVLEDVLEMTRSRWMDEANRLGKRIEIVRSYDDVAPVAGNISELREVFTNLILNAVDAIPDEGMIQVCTVPAGDAVNVLISDTGEGMSPEVQRRLFDPFFTTKGPRGNGLGMSIVYGIIRRHGGDIEVQSERNQGTLFRVSLPALGQEGLVEDPAPAEEAPSLEGSGRILVVDDEDDIRELVAEILADAGYEVSVARDGTEAVERVRERCFDLVVTDLGMPSVTGWDVAREARAAQPGIRLILLTGWGSTLDAGEVERHGIDRTLKKPFDMNVLLSAVGEVTGNVTLRRSA